MLEQNELYNRLPEDKHDLERATALVTIGYPAVTPILPELLEWMQDGNWPVTRIFAPFLASIGNPLTEQVRRIFQTQDHVWKYWVLLRVVAQSTELATALYSDLVNIAESDPVNDDEREIKEIAKEIISRS